LYEYRMGNRPPKGTAKRTPLQAIRAKCLELNNGSAKLTREDGVPYPINPWRLGKRPPVEETYYTQEDELIWCPWEREEEQQKKKTTRPSTEFSLEKGKRSPSSSRRRSTGKRPASYAVSAENRENAAARSGEGRDDEAE